MSSNGREAQTGRFTVGNRGGGRRPLPSFVKEAGEDALRVLIEVASGAREDRRVSQAQAAELVADRVYGRAAAVLLDESERDVAPAVLAIIEAAVTRRLAQLGSHEAVQTEAERVAALLGTQGNQASIALGLLAEKPKDDA